MIRGGFKVIGHNYGNFRYKLNYEKVRAICCISDFSNFVRKLQKHYAGDVVEMSIERCEKQLMFNDDKYHNIRRVAPSLLEQVLNFNDSTIDDFINNSPKW